MRIKDISIKKKLITIVTSISLCSTILVSFMSYQRYTDDLQSQSGDHVLQIMDQLSLNVDNYLDDLFKLSLSPYYNIQIMELLENDEPKSDIDLFFKARTINEHLDQMMVTPRVDILRVFIIADQIYTGGRSSLNSQLNPNYRNEDWYQQALRTTDTVFLPASRVDTESGRGIEVFSIVKQLNSLDNPGNRLGVLRVDANYTGIQNICDRIDLGEGGLLLYDDNGKVIYSSARGLNSDEIIAKTSGNSDSYVSLANSNGADKRYLVTRSDVGRTNWHIVSLSSIEELNKNAKDTRNATIIFALLTLAVTIMIMLVLIHGFLRPLLKIVKLMAEVKRGNLAVQFPDSREDEIGFLGASFNGMVSNIATMLDENTKLTKEIFEARYLQKEAQITSLYNQIRPHFIYNTLNSIHILIQMQRYEQATNNIHQLSLMMRSLAHWNRKVRLKEEILLLEAYLGLQMSRFEDRLAYAIDIDPSIYHYSVPALILQPIVENSVVHGCENKKGITTIRIHSIITSTALTIHVDDDGAGMSEEKLHQLRLKLEGSEAEQGNRGESAGEEEASWLLKSGIGLANVHRRLQIEYGEAYGLSIAGREHGGTSVVLHLPLQLRSLEE